MGKGAGAGGDSSARATEDKPLKWIKISGKYYDVTDFRHPGGNIIDLFKGMVSRWKSEKAEKARRPGGAGGRE